MASATIFAPNWGISSVGRALAWHARGHRFESGILHSLLFTKPLLVKGLLFYNCSFLLYVFSKVDT